MFEVKSDQFKVFKNGSHTFFFYSLFFPKEKKVDVFYLYAFVRIADELVDQSEPNVKLLKEFETEYITGDTQNEFILHFLRIEKKYNFNKKWTQAFFKSMKTDLVKNTYKDITELNEYIYGVAEVIGLYLVNILELPANSIYYAKTLGRALQYINIIRDIDIDKRTLGREYIPQEYLKRFNLENLNKTTAYNNKENFIKFMNFLLDEYFKVQEEAEKGYKFIPRNYLIPIKSAADAYKLTAIKIRKNPLLIFEGKVKPNKIEFIKILISNLFYKAIG